MQKQLVTWKFIRDCLQKKLPVMLLYVLESKGSSPGRRGFFMAVNAVGEMHGSIGGGIMEFKFVELAKKKLKDAAEEVSVHHQLHDKIAARNQSGMICSGEQTLFLYTVQLKDLAPINAMIRSLEEYQQGSLQLSPAGVGFSNDVPKENFLLEIRPNDNFLYIEKTGFKNNLYIIGAGHCALSLSKLMSSMDYCIHVFDDRQDLNTLMLNEYAHKKILVNDYKELDALIPSSNNCFAVIMTVGYRTDEVALKALLDKDLAYLGILGSKSKIDKLFKSLVEEGISSALLGKVHAPIGIQIKSQTPEEIAVSIAAEIIREKNRDL